MVELILGDSGQDRRNYIVRRMSETDNTNVILDYRDEYDDLDGKVVDLGLVDPRLSPLSYKDISAINAGVSEYQGFLRNKSVEVLKDNAPKNTEWSSYKMDGLLRESLDRCLNSWNDTEKENALVVRRFLSFTKVKQSLSMDDVIEECREEKTIIVKASDLHSTEVRLLTFLFLSKLNEDVDGFSLFSDGLNNVWRDGHLFLLLDTLDFRSFDFYMSLNRTSNIPDLLFPKIEKYVFFKKSSKRELIDLMNRDNRIDAKEISRVTKLKTEQYLVVDTKEYA